MVSEKTQVTFLQPVEVGDICEFTGHLAFLYVVRSHKNTCYVVYSWKLLGSALWLKTETIIPSTDEVLRKVVKIGVDASNPDS